MNILEILQSPFDKDTVFVLPGTTLRIKKFALVSSNWKLENDEDQTVTFGSLPVDTEFTPLNKQNVYIKIEKVFVGGGRSYNCICKRNRFLYHYENKKDVYRK